MALIFLLSELRIATTLNLSWRLERGELNRDIYHSRGYSYSFGGSLPVIDIYKMENRGYCNDTLLQRKVQKSVRKRNC